MEKVNFTDPDTNESAEFYVLEQRMKMITIPSMKWWKMIKS